jgi:propionyl-CoA synthetase
MNSVFGGTESPGAGFDKEETSQMSRYEEFYRQSVDAPEAFWAEQARLIDWQTPPAQVLDASRPPFARWFVDGTTNLCHNALDRHLATRGDQPALIFVSTETGTEKTLTASASSMPRYSAPRPA